MVDPIQLRLKMGVAVLLGATWAVAILVPILLGGLVAMPDALFWWLFGGLLAYFVYTGVRAWRRGWRSRFILRVVVPIVLLIASSILEWVGVWRLLLNS